MKAIAILKVAILSFALATTALANTYGSVEPIVNSAVVDTSTLGMRALPFARPSQGGPCSAASWTM